MGPCSSPLSSRSHSLLQLTHLQIQTSLGRCLYYGPFLVPDWSLAEPLLSPFGHEASHRASGLFVKPMTRKAFHLRSIGLVQEMRRQPRTSPPAAALSVPALTNLETGSFCEYYDKGAFATKAAFLDAREIRLQTVDSQCGGLLAVFQDGTKQTLGRWDPAQPETISTIYQAAEDSTFSPLRSITFMFSDGPVRERFVQAVLVNETHDQTAPHFKWDTLSRVRAGRRDSTALVWTALSSLLT
jgi:hypothetical protein